MTSSLYFVSESDRPKGFVYPDSYCKFVSEKSNGAAVIGMPPWIFASNELWAMEESENVFGKSLVPFAQAENMDMVAYFEANDTGSPPVWVADPWGESVYEKFESFSAWLEYATDLTGSFLKENPHYKGNKFWFSTT